jgi:hypothetical protein
MAFLRKIIPEADIMSADDRLDLNYFIFIGPSAEELADEDRYQLQLLKELEPEDKSD